MGKYSLRNFEIMIKRCVFKKDDFIVENIIKKHVHENTLFFLLKFFI